MRIALISEDASPLDALGGIDAGGQNIHVAHVANCLLKLGHQVDVHTRRDAVQQPPVVQVEAGLRVLHLPAGPADFVRHDQLPCHVPEFADRCEHLCAAGPRYDVVHANGLVSGGVALRLKQRLGLPYVLALETTAPAARSPGEQAIVRGADAIVSDELLGEPAARPRLTTMSRGDARRELGLDADAFIVLQQGSLVPRAGIENVVRALALLPRRMLPRLLIVGGESNPPDEHTTPEVARLRSVAQDLGVGDLLSFEGCQPRYRWPAYCAASNVLVSTPWDAPDSDDVLDAMAFGLPVIAGAVGALQQAVVDGVTGFLVPPADPAALAEHLLYLRAHPALAHALGSAGSRHARTLSAWATLDASLLATYADLPARLAAKRRVAAATAAGVGERTGPAASLPLVAAK